MRMNRLIKGDTLGNPIKAPHMQHSKDDPHVIHVGRISDEFTIPGKDEPLKIAGRTVIAKWSFVRTTTEGKGIFRCRQTGKEFEFNMRNSDEPRSED